MKGLLADIYRPAEDPEDIFGGVDCTNGGVSSRVTRAILVGEGIPEIFEPTADAPAFTLRRNWRNYWYVVPLPEPDKGKVAGPMFGGNFLYTTDSRFPSSQPLPIHDRYEKT